jgi:hypothetical protein
VIDRRPFITDPRHQAAVAGSAWLVLRPGPDLEAAFEQFQEVLRKELAGEDVSFPGPHVSIQGFDTEDERALVAVVDEWAMATPPLSIRTLRLAGFPAPDQTAVIEIEEDPQLRSALLNLRELSVTEGLSVISEIDPEDWTFHLSVAYCSAISAAKWKELMQLASATEVPRIRCTVPDAELVAFDGGQERLVRTFPLTGS